MGHNDDTASLRERRASHGVDRAPSGCWTSCRRRVVPASTPRAGGTEPRGRGHDPR